MNKCIKNNEITENNAELMERDNSCFCDASRRTPWFSAKEVAGLPQMPTTARRSRDELERLVNGQEHLKRKRAGTKGYEYHISLLPYEAQKKIINMMHFEGKELLLSKPAPIDSLSPPYINFADEFALIPDYRIQVSSGHGSLNDEQIKPTCYLAFRRKWLKSRGFEEKDLTIVWAKGDSMEPTIHNNDALVVNMVCNKPLDGNIYIFNNGGNLFVKRYQNALGAWRLISDNPIYDKIDIPIDEQRQFEVVGQVVHISKDISD